MLSTGAIIFVNQIPDQIKEVLINQLFITKSMSGEDFDGYVLSDGYKIDGYIISESNYVNSIRSSFQRILVIRSFENLKNENLADVSIFIKSGLASIQKNNFGPPLQTYQAAYLTLEKILGTKINKDVIII